MDPRTDSVGLDHWEAVSKGLVIQPLLYDKVVTLNLSAVPINKVGEASGAEFLGSFVSLDHSPPNPD